MATSNLKDFQFDLKNFGEKVLPEIHARLIKKIAFELFTRIVLKTPVDTGRARANWSVAVAPAEVPWTPPVFEVDKDGTATIAKGTGGINSADPAKQIIWIQNNLSYITALEDGHSQQAPAGMVEGSLNEIQNFINQLKDVEVLASAHGPVFEVDPEGTATFVNNS